MNCPECGGGLEVDDEIDSVNVCGESIIENFKCDNEECGKQFEIEFALISMTEI